MDRFKSPGSAQKFLSARAVVYNTSMHNAILSLPEHTEVFAQRLRARGAWRAT